MLDNADMGGFANMNPVCAGGAVKFINWFCAQAERWV